MRLVSPVYVCPKAPPVTPISSPEGIVCRASASRNPRTRGESRNRRRLVVSDARKSCGKHSEDWLGATAASLVSSSATDYSRAALARGGDSSSVVSSPVNRGSLRLPVEQGPEPRHKRLGGKVPGPWLRRQNQCHSNQDVLGCGKERTRVFRFSSMSSIHSELNGCFKCHRYQEQAA